MDAADTTTPDEYYVQAFIQEHMSQLEKHTERKLTGFTIFHGKNLLRLQTEDTQILMPLDKILKFLEEQDAKEKTPDQTT